MHGDRAASQPTRLDAIHSAEGLVNCFYVDVAIPLERTYHYRTCQSPTELYATECASGLFQRYRFLHSTCRLLVEAKSYADADLKEKKRDRKEMPRWTGVL